jgi:hypothetical protein
MPSRALLERKQVRLCDKTVPADYLITLRETRIITKEGPKIPGRSQQ